MSHKSNALKRIQLVAPIRPNARRCVAAVWLLVVAPACILMLVVVTELSNLWLARVQLENALEAAALAGVQIWGDTGSLTNARAGAVEMALANAIVGEPLVITPNGGGPGANENASCSGNVILGGITIAPPTTFAAGTAPDCGALIPIHYGVRCQATVAVDSLWSSIFGFTVGQHDVSATATALYICPAATGGPPRIVQIDTYTCP